MTTPPPSTPDAPTLAEKMPQNVQRRLDNILRFDLKNPATLRESIPLLVWAAYIAGQEARREVPRAASDVITERERQVAAEGWTRKHDDEHNDGQLASAAACYARYAGRGRTGYTPSGWPWAVRWWKPKDRRRDLVRAGALIIAEIERLDRDAAQGESP